MFSIKSKPSCPVTEAGTTGRKDKRTNAQQFAPLAWFLSLVAACAAYWVMLVRALTAFRCVRGGELPARTGTRVTSTVGTWNFTKSLNKLCGPTARWPHGEPRAGAGGSLLRLRKTVKRNTCTRTNRHLLAAPQTKPPGLKPGACRESRRRRGRTGCRAGGAL